MFIGGCFLFGIKLPLDGLGPQKSIYRRTLMGWGEREKECTIADISFGIV
jgi:hypothetical protein